MVPAGRAVYSAPQVKLSQVKREEPFHVRLIFSRRNVYDGAHKTYNPLTKIDIVRFDTSKSKDT